MRADLRGLAISGLSRRVVLDLLSSVAAVDKHHYPETLAACFLINPPASLSMVLRMVTPLINPATRRKVSAGSNTASRKCRMALCACTQSCGAAVLLRVHAGSEQRMRECSAADGALLCGVAADEPRLGRQDGGSAARGARLGRASSHQRAHRRQGAAACDHASMRHQLCMHVHAR